MRRRTFINRKRANKIYAFAHGANSATARLHRSSPRNQFADAAFIGGSRKNASFLKL
jgi:hypothetical protein